MTVDRKVTGRAMAMPVGIALGTAVSFGVTLLLAGALAFLVLEETVPQNMVGYGSMVILLLASCIGGVVSAGTVKHRRLLVSALTGLCFYVLLLCQTALFFGGQYEGFGVTALVVVIGTAASVGLEMTVGDKKGTYKRNYRTR